MYLERIYTCLRFRSLKVSIIDGNLRDQSRDHQKPLQISDGPITGAQVKRFREALQSLCQHMWSKLKGHGLKRSRVI